MKSDSSLKSKPETPKTPGGISKSLLTPCRRVGLSRNWKKSVASPFNSPLASTEDKQDNVETRKRKESLKEAVQETEKRDESGNVGTPARKVELPRRKKSKTLLNSIIKTTEDDSSQPDPSTPETTEASVIEDIVINNTPKVISTPVRLKSKSKESAKANGNTVQQVTTPVRLKTKSKKNVITNADTNPNCAKATEDNNTEKENIESSNKLIESKHQENNKTNIEKENTGSSDSKNKKKNKTNIEIENTNNNAKRPNNLTKECIVVIQKKIFKNQLKNNDLVKDFNIPKQPKSQTLFNDSDSDDVSLNCLNKTETDAAPIETITIDDDDFATTSKPKKIISNKSIKEKSNPVKATKESKKTLVNVQIHNPPSQSSIDDDNDDDDDFFEKKRTILVKKTYDKVIKPLKAKSTGSITQKDIDELKARIETKKKLLLAKSMTETKELRELIKKWQKGCQDALMELMDLMKNKCPQQNMEYSQILQTLKIPANLVGYDSDNDCFVTPEDENIILSHLKE